MQISAASNCAAYRFEVLCSREFKHAWHWPTPARAQVQEPDSFPEGRVYFALSAQAQRGRGESLLGRCGISRWDGESPRLGWSLFAGLGWELGKGNDLPRIRPEWLNPLAG
jgi:hypothetical protein